MLRAFTSLEVNPAGQFDVSHIKSALQGRLTMPVMKLQSNILAKTSNNFGRRIYTSCVLKCQGCCTQARSQSWASLPLTTMPRP